MTLRLLARKLTGLPRQDWADMVRAQVALLRAQVAVWVLPRGTIAEWIRNDVPEPATETISPTVLHLATAVSRAARFGLFRPRCLVRSLALISLLEARGFAGGRIRVGVRRQGPRFDAHAWVEYGGSVLGDRSSRVRRFAPLADLNVRKQA